MGRRRRALVGWVLVVAATLGLVACGSDELTSCDVDAVTHRSLTDLASFSDWLRSNGVRGVVGEVGWPAGPDQDRWNTLASRWYDQAGTDSVGAFAWSGADRWPASYPLAVYRRSSPEGAVPPTFAVGPQAEVVEGRDVPGGSAGGVALADGSFGASWDEGAAYSAADPGVFGVDYSYPSRELLDLVRSRGVQQVRLAVTWERLQPRPGAELDPAGVRRLRDVLSSAAAAGVSVVIDLHNYGRFATGSGAARRVLTLGSPDLPASDLADFWDRLTVAVQDESAISGYGLMNEPHDLPGGATAWEAASEAAVVAVREHDTTTPVLVGGYSYSSVARWTTTHPRPWIPPTLWPVVYEAHQYFDSRGEGTYPSSYADVDAAVRADGWSSCAAPSPAG